MALPYMGSKRKSASKIVNLIEAYCPDNDKLIVELFTGGFAVGEKFLKKGYKVIANDKNKYVIALLDQVINRGLDENKCLERVSREKFKDVLQNPSKYEDWYVGYVMCIWSFGNNQKGYLFGNENEIKKKSLFNLVVNKEVDEFVKKIMPQKYIDGICKQKDWHIRRMALKKVMGVLKNRSDLESLERLQSLESLQSLEDQVEFINKSYEEVEIQKNAIVYCDPPYQGTAEYKEGAFNHSKFREYIRNLSKTNKVFISEYSAPIDMTCIYEFPQKSLLSGKGAIENKHTEKVFIYKII